MPSPGQQPQQRRRRRLPRRLMFLAMAAGGTVLGALGVLELAASWGAATNGTTLLALRPVTTAQQALGQALLWSKIDEPDTMVVRELLRRGNGGRSSQGKRHRSLICALTRNEGHLREWVVRNLLAGFGHIVLYDNNQVEKGIDLDIRPMLAPFVAAGAVTLVSWNQNASAAHLSNEAKNNNSQECVARYGHLADWVTVMDTDEFFYLQRNDKESNRSSSVGVLASFLSDLEHRAPNTCAVSFPWRMMYGEHRFLKPSGMLLLDAYPRVCAITEASKIIFRPDRVQDTNMLPHYLSCSDPIGVQYQADTGLFRYLLPAYQDSRLLHYYEKSVEEWLVKMEQSIAPFERYLSDYAAACQTRISPTTYDPEYKAIVHEVMRGLQEANPVDDGGIFLGPLPELGEDFFVKAEEDYASYRFIKARVTQGIEWDEAEYLRQHPDFIGEEKEQERDNVYVDGLHYFLGQRLLQEAGEKCCWMPNSVKM